LTFLVEAQLFAQEEILASEGRFGLKETAQEPNEVHHEAVKGQGGVRKAFV
jgi:hypothetical protein